MIDVFFADTNISTVVMCTIQTNDYVQCPSSQSKEEYSTHE